MNKVDYTVPVGLGHNEIVSSVKVVNTETRRRNY